MPAPEQQEQLLGFLGLSARGHYHKSSEGVNFEHKSPFCNSKCYWCAAPLAVPAGLGASTPHGMARWFKRLKQEVSFAFLS